MLPEAREQANWVGNTTGGVNVVPKPVTFAAGFKKFPRNKRELHSSSKRKPLQPPNMSGVWRLLAAKLRNYSVRMAAL